MVAGILLVGRAVDDAPPEATGGDWSIGNEAPVVVGVTVDVVVVVVVVVVSIDSDIGTFPFVRLAFSIALPFITSSSEDVDETKDTVGTILGDNGCGGGSGGGSMVISWEVMSLNMVCQTMSVTLANRTRNSAGRL